MKHLRPIIIILVLTDWVIKYLLISGNLSLNFSYDDGFFPKSLQDTSFQIKVVLPLVISFYLNFMGFVSIFYLNRIKAFISSTALFCLMAGINGNLLERLLTHEVIEYFNIPFTTYMCNISDLVIIFSLAFALVSFAFEINKIFFTNDNRLPFSLNTRFQKDLFKLVFLSAAGLSAGLYAIAVLSFGGNTVPTLLTYFFGPGVILVNALILAVLAVERSHHSVGAITSLKRTVDSSNSLNELTVTLRDADYHQEELNLIVTKLKKLK